MWGVFIFNSITGECEVHPRVLKTDTASWPVHQVNWTQGPSYTLCFCTVHIHACDDSRTSGASRDERSVPLNISCPATVLVTRRSMVATQVPHNYLSCSMVTDISRLQPGQLRTSEPHELQWDVAGQVSRLSHSCELSNLPACLFLRWWGDPGISAHLGPQWL